MTRTTATTADRPSGAGRRRDDWLRNGVVAGFLATFGMMLVIAVAYGIANVLGDPAGGTIARWIAALGDNPVTQRTTNTLTLAVGLSLLVGLLLAVVYGRWVEPALGGAGAGPGARKGVIFALLPWLLSLALFLPLVGGGFFGAALGAGPLPILGNLVLHLVYGAILGGVYGLSLDSGLDGSAADRANTVAAEQGAAIGVAAGVLLGLIGGWLLGPQLSAGAGQGATTLAGAAIGGAVGLAVGSFAGMGKHQPTP